MGELLELRALSLEADKRAVDLARWSHSSEPSGGARGSDFIRGIREGLALAVRFLATGRFGPGEVCVHGFIHDRRTRLRMQGAGDACAECLAEAARELGSELDLLELEQHRRDARLRELVTWAAVYDKGDGEHPAGLSTGLTVAEQYLRTGVLRDAFGEAPEPRRAAQ